MLPVPSILATTVSGVYRGTMPALMICVKMSMSTGGGGGDLGGLMSLTLSGVMPTSASILCKTGSFLVVLVRGVKPERVPHISYRPEPCG